MPIMLAAGGYELYKKHCASCHVEYYPMEQLKKNFLEMNNTLLHLKAPTINQLSFRLKQQIGDPKGDEELHRFEVVEFIKEYVLHPDPSKSVCLKEVLRSFQTMPAMKIEEGELETIAEWIYDYTPKATHLQTSSFEEALQKAHRENKLILLEATSKECHYCKEMETEVLNDPEVVAFLDRYFVFVPVDVYEKSLPMGLKWQITPTFYIVDKDKRVLKVIPGAWKKGDFVELLQRIVK